MKIILYFVAVAIIAYGSTIVSRWLDSKKKRLSKEFSEISNSEIMKIIKEEGYQPQIESDGDISFSVNGTIFTFGRCGNGFVYGRAYYQIDKEDYMNALFAAQDVELSLVAIKVMISPNNQSLIFSVESLCGDSATFRIYFNRALSILSSSINHFSDKMREVSYGGTKEVTVAEE